MKKLNKKEMRAVEGGKYCKYCGVEYTWFEYIIHSISDSAHIGAKMAEKAKRKKR